jgi:hypothetical protein
VKASKCACADSLRPDPGERRATELRQWKDCLTIVPVLRVFDSIRRSVLTTDVSEKAISAIFTQPDDEGVHYAIAYESRKLTAAEQAYPAHVLELLAVVDALRVFRHYLLGSGAPRPDGVRSDFVLRTENQAVTWLRTKWDVNRFLAHWLDEIEEFRFDIEHVPGKLNLADPLTRRGPKQFAKLDSGEETLPGPEEVQDQVEISGPLFSAQHRSGWPSSHLNSRCPRLDNVGRGSGPVAVG